MECSTKIQRGILVWFLFFVSCWSLGYPTLNRYDPRSTPGTSDSVTYYRLVTESPQASLGFKGFRILVPYTAKPFYWMAVGRVGTWDPVLFSMLMANSFFCATAAYLLVRLGHQVLGDYSVALLGATLYLLNFTISNSHLSGMVDSGEGCLMMAVVWALFSNRWGLLWLLAFLGALAKETFVPLSLALALGWWLAEGYHNNFRLPQLAWIGLMAMVGLTTVSALQSIVSQELVWPWSIAASMQSQVSFLRGLAGCILDRNFWYVFLWILPVGIFKLRRIPPPWVWGAGFSTLSVLALGAYHDSRGGNVARAMFNTIGPVLSLSAAVLLTSSYMNLPRCQRNAGG